MSNVIASDLPVMIDSGLVDWQILQQDQNGYAKVTLRGRWSTMIRRDNPEVRVRIAREGTYTAVSRSYDWVRAEMNVNENLPEDQAGKSGTWTVTLDRIPRGGPYRLDTLIGGGEDAMEWRNGGVAINFFCVGDIFLIAGQSNASGTAKSPVDDPAEIGVHEYLPRGGWRLATHGWNHHPWLAFAKTLKKELGYPIGLIPTAVGGSEISRWDPIQQGDLYNAMSQCIQGAGGAVKGVLWYQGESDVGEQRRPEYKARFTRFAAGVRELTREPELPIITVQLNRVLRKDDAIGWEAIREYQRQLSHELQAVYLISVFESVLCDIIHNGSLGNLLIAQRACDTALGGIYGRDIAFRHPECSRAVQTAADAVELHFDHVNLRLDYMGAGMKEFPFAVRDRQGEVPATGFEIADRNKFRIQLTRAIDGPGTVTGAPGACPPHIVPRDIQGHRGMLAFTLDIEPMG